MGRTPCCDKVGLKKGPWTPEEDQKLLSYIDEHGHGSWRALPTKAGLERCGKSCRLRWTNYLRPDIKRGKFTLQEEQTIIQLHALLGNRWSAIATHLPKRTDNEIKNYWNTHLKKRLTKLGIDPVTHKPKSDTLSSNEGQSKNEANLSHMAQWESARLEAEARLVRESKLRSSSFHNQLGSPAATSTTNKLGAPHTSPPCLDILKAWNGVWNNKAMEEGGGGSVAGHGGDLESPTSTISFADNGPPVHATGIGSSEDGIMKEKGEEENWKGLGNPTHLPGFKDEIYNSMWVREMTIMPMEGAPCAPESLKTGKESVSRGSFVERFTELLLNNSGDRSCSEGGGGGESDHGDGGVGGGGSGSEFYEDNKNYWNSILNLVDSSPSDSPMF